jgi:hypothetical protein
MKLELFILAVTAFFIYNAYHDGKYTKMFFLYKKYFQMALLALVGISLYLLIKRDPLQCKKMLFHANNVVKYMPISKSSLDMFTPIMDFTSQAGGFIGEMNQAMNSSGDNHFEKQLLQRGGNGGNGENKPTKRSVSETKKKFVASNQNWKCGKCNTQLNHTFEIDHKKRLEYGGTNDVNNLIALCRNCHGEKTAMENM